MKRLEINKDNIENIIAELEDIADNNASEFVYIVAMSKEEFEKIKHLLKHPS